MMKILIDDVESKGGRRVKFRFDPVFEISWGDNLSLFLSCNLRHPNTEINPIKSDVRVSDV